MENVSTEKSRPLSAKQKQTLIEYVHSRPEMYRGTFSPTYTYATSVILWKQITEILISIPDGSRKDWKQWRKTFIDIKKNVESKQAQKKAYSQGTGGGPPLPSPKDDDNTDIGTEEKILEIITPVAISGNKEVPEPEILLEDIYHIEDFVSEDHSYSLKDTPQPRTSKDIPEAQKKTIPESLNQKTAGETEIMKGSGTNNSSKRMTKSARLTQSLRSNKDFLSISQTGIKSTDSYRNKKLEILRIQTQNQERYYEENLGILRDISQAFNKIAKYFDEG